MAVLEGESYFVVPLKSVMYYYYSHPYGSITGIVMMIFLFILILVALWAIFSGGRYRWRERNLDDRDRAMIILRERYAKGEINKEEFEARKKDLG
ncbi:MAG TPA: SHOCT domain-containing protein [Patescibacteria group bacterium]|nr:SHOCT domain-containing protein [Patescibacteria group bacterium]